MESQLTCEARLQAGNIARNVADVLTSCSDHIEPKAPDKKRTRKWAAWTRQEEESFFNALRQVGKNFEKITYHVQSKNKDQVRHYYYRLIRRMNKLLGPDFSLDAKNSKDANAAMLRWWSLLEKHSCRASKLHLKPRRFKIFIDALAHQLLKDRRKSMRRYSMPGENVVATAVSSQEMAFGHDTHEVKVVVVDGQNIQKIGSRRGLSSRCSRKGAKGELSTFKTAKPQRKTGGSVSAAAYRKWKKAAVAGVSLVADAAEHLERIDTLKESVQVQNSSGQMNLDAGEYSTPLPSVPESLLGQNDAKNPVKLKLQLFPVDEGTRRALEMDRCNPHLELTLSSRKKISSVLEHLNQKWGNSSIASGKIMLFPYEIQKEGLVAYPSWSKDSGLTATDLHKLIGTPPIFRLRYGWILNPDPVVFTSELSSMSCLNSANTTLKMINVKQPLLESKILSPSKITAEASQNQRNSVMEESVPSLSSLSGGISNETFHHANASVAYRPCSGMVDAAATTMITIDNDNLITREVRKASTQEGIEGNTNISIGDLLSEVETTHEMDIDASKTCFKRSQNFQPIPFISDSFDVAVAAHISRHQDSVFYQHSVAPHTSSIWNAEETCDAFSFKKKSEGNQGAPILERNSCADSTGQNTGCLEMKSFPEAEVSIENPVVDILDGDRSTMLKDLTDVYWPDSLGPLDLDIRSCRYHSEDMILCDSLGGLNHLLAGSLDSFQNCSFGMNGK